MILYNQKQFLDEFIKIIYYVMIFPNILAI